MKISVPKARVLKLESRSYARSHSRSLPEFDVEELDGSNCLDAEWIGCPRAGQHVSVRVSIRELLAPILSYATEQLSSGRILECHAKIGAESEVGRYCSESEQNATGCRVSCVR